MLSARDWYLRQGDDKGAYDSVSLCPVKGFHSGLVVVSAGRGWEGLGGSRVWEGLGRGGEGWEGLGC